MKRLIVILVLCLTMPRVVDTQPFSYKKTAAEVTVAGTAIALFTSTDVQGAGHPDATVANCSLTGANIRVSYSGTDPTSTLGEILTPGLYTITGTDVMLAAKGIRDDSTSATWNCILQGL